MRIVLGLQLKEGGVRLNFTVVEGSCHFAQLVSELNFWMQSGCGGVASQCFCWAVCGLETRTLLLFSIHFMSCVFNKHLIKQNLL